MNKFFKLLDSITISYLVNKYLIILFAIFGFILSISQFFGTSRDYQNYDDFFNLIRDGGYAVILEDRFEPGFSILSLVFISIFNANLVVYSSFVFISMFLKGLVISNCSPGKFLFILVAIFYFARYLPLHELTQLRLSVAMGFILLGAIIVWSGRIFLGCIVCILALSFHMSTAAIIPIIFINQFKRRHIILITAATFAFSFLLVDFTNEYLSKFIRILNDYKENSDQFEKKPNPLAIYLLIDLAMIIWSFLYWNKLSKVMRRIVFIEMVGFSIFYGTMDFPAIAIRVRELYSVFWIIFTIEGLNNRNTITPVALFLTTNIFFYFYLFFLYKEIPFFQ